MTEKEKMLAGQWYDANSDKTLLDLRLKAEQSCYDFKGVRRRTVNGRRRGLVSPRRFLCLICD